MVTLDLQLICRAQRFINGANVHSVKEMIFAYEQAVELHNCQWPRFETYQMDCELKLRKFVREQQEIQVRRRMVA